jgi:hypothetical protein
MMPACGTVVRLFGYPEAAIYFQNALRTWLTRRSVACHVVLPASFTTRSEVLANG